MSWAAERRANRAAAAEQNRLDADAASGRRIREQAAAAEQARADRKAAGEQTRADRAAAAKRTAEAKARRARWRARVGQVAAAHRVGLLIYPLAVASGVMAIPSVATYGMQVYGGPTGTVLPVLTELGMWAFALAVTVRRRYTPNAPVWALHVGVWAFAGVGFAINAAHGVEQGGPTVAVVMGMASIAGLVAHQLVIASGVRGRLERQEARTARREAAKTARVRRAAVRHAIATVDERGHAQLLYSPGRYVLGRTRLGGARLTTAPEPSDRGGASEWGVAAEAAEWLAAHTDPGSTGQPTDEGESTEDGGPVATLDRDSPNFTGDGSADRGTGRGVDSGHELGKSRRNRGSIPAPRSIEQLRAELTALIGANPAGVDVGSAESIRRVLRCSPARARQLRGEHRQEGPA